MDNGAVFPIDFRGNLAMPEPEVDLVKVINDLNKNAEAGVVLVTIATVDEWLEKLLLAGMREGLSNEVVKRIFGSYGPLYEFASKVDIAYALDLIDMETLDSLRVLKDIRNAFAHTRELLHFESERISKLCQKLPGWKQGTNNRELFDRIAVECLKKIDAATEKLVFAYATSD
jgi:DNA-binding MltR family transcriptional regulator